MNRRDRMYRQAALYGELRWFIRLRWIAGLAVIVGALIDWLWLDWYADPWRLALVGGIVLAYNAALGLRLRPFRDGEGRYGSLVTLAWIQIVLDLACLTLLTVWTGAMESPLLGFFVFHMVIASLLLPPSMGYVGAGISGLMLGGVLWFSGQWPTGRLGLQELLGWLLMLLITVYLTGTISRSLRRHRLRILRQRHRIRSMSEEIRRNRRAMIQQEKMAAMGQMAAGVAHEITNPLASMDSLLQLFQRNPERIADESVGKLREQIARISQIVRQLTDFAHPSHTAWETVAIGDVVARALQMVRFDHRIRNVEMHLEQPQGDLPAVAPAQPRALEQVLVNLIINALDAMADEPAPRLDIRAWREGDQCFIQVADNGHGIAPEHVDHLFDPFFTTKPVGKGTGLGLAISYRLIRSHRGRIEVESKGQGAKFTICLPAAKPAS